MPTNESYGNNNIIYKFDGFNIYALANAGVDAGVQIRYNQNLDTIERTINSQNVVTRLRGRGVNGLTIEGLDVSKLTEAERVGLTTTTANGQTIVTKDYFDSEFISNYPIPREAIMEWADVEDPGVLIEKMRLKIAELEVPEITYTVTFAEFTRQGVPFSDVNLYDIVTVVDEGLGINVKAKVMRITKKPNNIDMTTIDLVTRKQSVVDYLNELKSTKDWVKNDRDNINKKFDQLELAIQMATNLLNGTNSKVVVTDTGLYSYDTTTLGPEGQTLNTTHLLKIATGAVGVSINGGATFDEAITPYGINASKIVGDMIISRLGQFNKILVNDDDGNPVVTLGKFTSSTTGQEVMGIQVDGAVFEILDTNLFRQNTDYTNGVRIDSVDGVVTTRGDKKFRAIQNGQTGFKLQKGDGSGIVWVDKMWTDTNGDLYLSEIHTDNISILSGGDLLLDAANRILDLSQFTTIIGKLKGTNIDADTLTVNAAQINGRLTADQIYTKFIQSADANVNRLTVDHLMTNDNDGDIETSLDYVEAQGKYLSFVTSTRKCDAGGVPLPDIQLTDANNAPLYWTDATKAGQSTVVTDFPVMVHQYDKNEKLKIYHTTTVEPGVAVPVIQLGVGTDNDPNTPNGQGFIYKGANGLHVKYYSSTGNLREITMDETGIKLNAVNGTVDLGPAANVTCIPRFQ